MIMPAPALDFPRGKLEKTPSWLHLRSAKTLILDVCLAKLLIVSYAPSEIGVSVHVSTREEITGSDPKRLQPSEAIDIH